MSEFGRRRLVRAGYDPGRIRVIPNPSAVPDTVSPLDEKDPACFLFLGRIVAEKGLPWLVEALALCREPSTLVVLGSGPDEARTQQLVAERGLTTRVSFRGWRHDAEVPGFLAPSRAVVIPSLWHEPAGLAAIEAAMYGRPSIASAVGGLREIIVAGSTGILVPPGDTRALAAALDRLARDPVLSANLGAAGQERARRLYSIDNHVARLLESYSEAA